jgi:CHAD domain-containing protein
VSAVHDARKALKKTRAVLRLGRGRIDRAERRRANITLRDAGRALSCARDAEVMLQAVDGLADRFAGQVPQVTFDAVRGHLEAQRDPARQRLIRSGLTEKAADELRAVRADIGALAIHPSGWKALEPGVLSSYRRGRAAYERAGEQPTVTSLHEWRKRTKDLWYHLRMLIPLAPGIVGGQADEAHELSDLLGDDHDLAVPRDSLHSSAGALPVDLDPVFGFIEHRRVQLQGRALVIGARLYAEPPKAFRRRIRRYWKVSRSSGARRRASHA